MVSVASEVQAPSARPAPHSLGCRQDPGSAPGGGADVRCCEGAAGDPSGARRASRCTSLLLRALPAVVLGRDPGLMSAFSDQDVWAA